MAKISARSIKTKPDDPIWSGKETANACVLTRRDLAIVIVVAVVAFAVDCRKSTTTKTKKNRTKEITTNLQTTYIHTFVYRYECKYVCVCIYVHIRVFDCKYACTYVRM